MKIFTVPGGKLIQYRDAMLVCEQQLRQVTSDKPGASG